MCINLKKVNMMICNLLTGISYQWVFSKFVISKVFCVLSIFFHSPNGAFDRHITHTFGSLAGVGEEIWGEDIYEIHLRTE